MGDFTYLRCWEGKLYFAFIIDVFPRKIVGWQLASHMRTDLVLDALRMALGIRQPGADFTLVTHTDQGSQYVSDDYTQVIDDHRSSHPSAQSAMPTTMRWPRSFVDRFKTELIKDRVWQTRSQLELAILEYVDWFNNRRLHESLGDIPPVEFEQLHATRTDAIAGDPSVAALSPSASEPLTARRFETRPAENHLDEPGPARTAPSLVVDESSQLVSLTLGSDHHQQMETN